jgi:hypothetical protein
LRYEYNRVIFPVLPQAGNNHTRARFWQAVSTPKITNKKGSDLPTSGPLFIPSSLFELFLLNLDTAVNRQAARPSRNSAAQNLPSAEKKPECQAPPIQPLHQAANADGNERTIKGEEKDRRKDDQPCEPVSEWPCLNRVDLR